MHNELRGQESIASIIVVVKMGSSAYQDKERFPDGAYCKKVTLLSFVLYGTRFKVMGKEFRLINDDTVEAVIDDPGLYKYE